MNLIERVVAILFLSSNVLVGCGGEELPDDLIIATAQMDLASARRRTPAAPQRAPVTGRAVASPVALAGHSADTGDTGGFEEICDLPEGYSWVGGRCQVGLEGGGTMECDCEASMHTSHDANGDCVYEVEDLVVVGNCGQDDGETNPPPEPLPDFMRR